MFSFARGRGCLCSLWQNFWLTMVSETGSLSSVAIGEGPLLTTAEDALERVIGQLESNIATAEKDLSPAAVPSTTKEALVPIFPGFPSTLSGDILFCDADNINTGTYLRSLSFQTQQSSSSTFRAALFKICPSNTSYDPQLTLEKTSQHRFL